MVHFFCQDDPVGVSKFLCECLGVLLDADSDNQNQTSDPHVAGQGETH